jgi:hypothetical protein
MSQTEGYYIPSRNTSTCSGGGGGGTTVRRSFEGTRVMPAAKPPEAEAVKPKAAAQEPKRPMHVLLIDDQEFNLRLLQVRVG